MTRKEILEGLYEIKNWKCNGDAKTHEVVTETIKILEQEPVLDKIRTEIEQMPSELTTDGRRMIRRGTVFRIIDKYKAESEE